MPNGATEAKLTEKTESCLSSLLEMTDGYKWLLSFHITSKLVITLHHHRATSCPKAKGCKHLQPLQTCPLQWFNWTSASIDNSTQTLMVRGSRAWWASLQAQGWQQPTTWDRVGLDGHKQAYIRHISLHSVFNDHPILRRVQWACHMKTSNVCPNLGGSTRIYGLSNTSSRY